MLCSAVSFMFVVFAIAVEDRGVLDPLRCSWLSPHGTDGAYSRSRSLSGSGPECWRASDRSRDLEPGAGQLVSVAITVPATMISYGILGDAYLLVREASSEGSTT